jgi:hypothetical protein
VLAAAGIFLLACQPAPQKTEAPAAATPGKLTAKVINSGFALAHDSYNSMGTASTGDIYYVLSSESIDQGAKMFRYDPKTGKSEEVGDVTRACGEEGKKTISQGKSHVNFAEVDGKLYFATHLGYYTIQDGREATGVPPAGYKPYPGGHMLSYDLKTRQFEDFGLAPNGEGIITFKMDTQRKRMYGITWPTGHFLRYDLAKKEWKDFGPMAQKGESVGQGPDYQTICRSIGIDPRDGSAYFSDSLGNIRRYAFDSDTVAIVDGEDLRKDYLGLYDPHSAGHMGYNWRQIFWHPATNKFYGVHGNSGYLFTYDPKENRVEIVDRITSQLSKRSGMFDLFSYGYLGFGLGPDGDTIYYLTGGPIYENGKRVKGKDSTAKGESKGREDLHLVTYKISTSEYKDHGAIFLPDGSRPEYVNSLTMGLDGTVYTLGRITENGKMRADLIIVRP